MERNNNPPKTNPIIPWELFTGDDVSDLEMSISV